MVRLTLALLMTRPCHAELSIQEDLQGRKYIEIVCGGRSGRLILDKFLKLESNKWYGKCITSLFPPQEIEAIACMKVMKCWKKSLKHNGQPLFFYLKSGALKESDVSTTNPTSVQGNTDPVSFSMNSAFMQLESRLLSSIQKVITSSISSLKTSIEFEIKSLHTEVSELTKRIQQLEEERLNLIIHKVLQMIHWRERHITLIK